jgi:hypothetical protein
MPTLNQYDLSREREAVMLRKLTELALAGQPLPGARGLSRMVGLAGGGGGNGVLARLEKAGHVTVTGWGDYKTVHILATRLSLSRGDARQPIAAILATVAAVTGLTVADITGPTRTKLYLRPRRLAAMLARVAGWSYPTIGKALRRDHSTAIHACERGAEMLASDPLFGRMYRRATAALAGLPAPSFTIPPRKTPAPKLVPPQAQKPAVKTAPGEYQARNALPPPVLCDPACAAPDEVAQRHVASFASASFLSALRREFPERFAA